MRFWYKAALIVAILTIPFAVNEGLKAEENDEETYRQLKLFGDVFERVRRREERVPDLVPGGPPGR